MDKAEIIETLDAAIEALDQQFWRKHDDDWSMADARRYAEDKIVLDKRKAILEELKNGL